MQLTLRVQHGDGTSTDVTATTIDILDFEEHFAKSFLTLTENLSYTDMCWLAWAACKRAGTAGDDFRAWASGVDVSFPSGEAVTTPVPLEQTASTSA